MVDFLDHWSNMVGTKVGHWRFYFKGISQVHRSSDRKTWFSLYLSVLHLVVDLYKFIFLTIDETISKYYALIGPYIANWYDHKIGPIHRIFTTNIIKTFRSTDQKTWKFSKFWFLLPDKIRVWSFRIYLLLGKICVFSVDWENDYFYFIVNIRERWKTNWLKKNRKSQRQNCMNIQTKVENKN